MPHLSLAFFGPIQVMLDGKPVTGFGYDKVRALLAYLAVESDRAHRRDALAGLLWPELDEEAARTNLRQVIAVLRGAIDDRSANPPFLLISRESVQWNPDSGAELDVARFDALIRACAQHPHRHAQHCKPCAQRLAEATALYRGGFLSQFFLPDSAPFEEWAVLKREVFQRQALEALARLVAFHEGSGAYDLAAGYAQRQLALEPWREEVHRQLMRLLVLNNQRSAALVQYEQCRRVLSEELGAEPEPETTVLYERIREQAQDAPVPPALIRLPAVKPHNLPPQLTPFVGREQELAEISRLLDDPTCRLVTVTGPGGIGKTRLALQATTEQLSAFNDGVFFVPLAPLNGPENLAQGIANALNVSLSGQEPAQAELVRCLQNKEMLLVLDNFEHLLDGAGLLAEILAAAPDVTLLVTSIEPLRIQGEWVLELSGLRYPGASEDDSGPNSEAFQLFETCARRVRSGFALSGQDQRAVARICCLLDGIPLAIELAAAWVGLLSCEEIASEIEADLDFLSAPQRDIPERHRSLRAVFDRAWQLLTPDQQAVFRRLSLFRGGFQRAAAEQIAGGNLPILKALLDKSLLQRSPSGRYGLHEYARQYAYQRLVQSGELHQVRDRHLAYYIQFSESIRPTLEGEEGATGMARMEEENDNLRAALEWSLESGHIESGLTLGLSLYRFWYWHSHFAEGRRWMEALLAALETRKLEVPAQLQAEASFKTGVLASVQHDQAKARVHLEKSLALYQAQDNRLGQAAALNSLGAIAFEEEDFRQAGALFEASLKLKQELGKQEALSIPLNNLGMVAQALGDYPRSQALYEEALAIDRAMLNQGAVAIDLGNIGLLMLAQCQYAQARALFIESMALRRALGDQEGVAYCLEGLAAARVYENQGVESARQAAYLYGAAEALRETLDIALTAWEKSQYEPSIRQARAILGEAAFVGAWDAGRHAPVEEAVKNAVEDG